MAFAPMLPRLRDIRQREDRASAVLGDLSALRGARVRHSFFSPLMSYEMMLLLIKAVSFVPPPAVG